MQRNKRILIFNVNWIGDVLFSTATIRNLRRNFPDSFISCIIPSRCYPVLKGNPNLDEIIIFDEKDRHKSICAKFRFINELKRKKFDIAVLLHGSLTRALICKLAGIKQIIGYDTKKRGFLLSKKIKEPAKDKMHRIDYYLNIIDKWGLRIEDRFTEFFVDETDQKPVAEFLKKNNLNKKLLIGINAGGNWLCKRWPKEHWATLADALIEKLKAEVIIIGGEQDISLAKEILHLMKQKAVIACGKFNLKQTAALFKKLDLFISADTGPLHIANAVCARRIIALFGPTHIAITGPYPTKNTVILQKLLGCKIPCYVVDCYDNRCMKEISPIEVLEEAKKLCA